MLPLGYQWLGLEPGPKMITVALSLYGVHEAPGGENNPVIIAWANELGLYNYRADDTPWCGLFMAKVAHDAGKEVHFAPLWARNWMSFGTTCSTPMLGDVLVFARPGGGGHVGLYVGEDDNAYHVLGGNEGDQVGIIRVSRARLVGARRPAYKVVPANVRIIRMRPDGPVSQNQA